MNIYAKLAAARVELQNADIKKSGNNVHLKFKYSELQDFLPSINMINKNLGLISIFNIGNEEAALVIVDTEADNNTTIIFSSPIAKATLQGKPSPIQELGSQHTYMRRYMYMLAYEIAEGDSVDADLGRQITDEEKKAILEAKEAEAKALLGKTTLARTSLRNFIKASGKEEEAIENYFKVKIDDMTIEQMDKVHETIQRSVEQQAKKG